MSGIIPGRYLIMVQSFKFLVLAISEISARTDARTHARTDGRTDAHTPLTLRFHFWTKSWSGTTNGQETGRYGNNGNDGRRTVIAGGKTRENLPSPRNQFEINWFSRLGPNSGKMAKNGVAPYKTVIAGVVAGRAGGEREADGVIREETVGNGK